jgi:hypothetical protein
MESFYLSIVLVMAGVALLSAFFLTLEELIEQGKGKLVYAISKNLLIEDALWPDPKP